MVAMMPPGASATVSVVRPRDSKATKVAAATPSMLQKYIPALAGETRPAGPNTLAANRDAWANAMETMGGVYTPSPLTAIAKVAGMGLAGYNAGKSERALEEGSQAFRTKMAQALTGGVPSNETLAGLMADPYSDGASEAIMKLWDRANPDPNNVKHNMVTIKSPNGAEMPLDLNDPASKAYYDKYLRDMQSGQQGGAIQQGAAGVKDPFKLTDNLQQSKVQQGAATVAGTLNSMFKSLSDSSAISDLDFVNGVAKILDPNSVVRTEEGRQVIESQSISSQTLGLLNKLANGETALDPKTRADMYELASRRGGEMLQQAQAETDFYRNMAEKNGYDPDTYVPKAPQGPRSDFTMDPQNPANMPQRSDFVPSPAASAAPPPAAPQPQATTPPPMPQPGPEPSESVEPVTPLIPPIPPNLQSIPMLRQLWPQIVQDLDGPGELDRFKDAIRSNPALLRHAYPEAFQSGVEQ